LLHTLHTLHTINMLNLDIPKIFPKNLIISGFTHKNPQISKDLENGLNFRVADTKECLISQKILINELKIGVEKINTSNQVHGNNVVIVDAATDTICIEADGMITQDKSIFLGAKSADCCVLLMFDPAKQAIGVAHSGRRGTEKNLAKNIVMKLNQEYGSDPQNILVYLCTSASVEAYEIDEKTAENWAENFKKIEKTESGFRYFLDIKKRIFSQLVEVGILEKNIEAGQNCSITDLRYHSYRRDGQKTKLAIGFIGWAKNS